MLDTADGCSRKLHYISNDERKSDNPYRKHLDTTRPCSFICDVVPTYAGL